jgi:hypothetical protein
MIDLLVEVIVAIFGTVVESVAGDGQSVLRDAAAILMGRTVPNRHRDEPVC